MSTKKISDSIISGEEVIKHTNLKPKFDSWGDPIKRCNQCCYKSFCDNLAIFPSWFALYAMLKLIPEHRVCCAGTGYFEAIDRKSFDDTVRKVLTFLYEIDLLDMDSASKLSTMCLYIQALEEKRKREKGN